jgi:hypothetical protein
MVPLMVLPVLFALQLLARRSICTTTDGRASLAILLRWCTHLDMQLGKIALVMTVICLFVSYQPCFNQARLALAEATMAQSP